MESLEKYPNPDMGYSTPSIKGQGKVGWGISGISGTEGASILSGTLGPKIFG